MKFIPSKKQGIPAREVLFEKNKLDTVMSKAGAWLGCDV